jgi:hypothetical protein
VKPFVPADLVAVVKNVLGDAAAGAAAPAAWPKQPGAKG